VDNKEVQLSIDVIDKANVEPRYDDLMREHNLTDKD
jgi:ribosome maturation factor RimP